MKDSKVFVVLIDWVDDIGENGSNAFVYESLEKAQAQLKEEIIAELDGHRGCLIYCEDKNIDLLNEFEIVDDMDSADFVVEITDTFFVCYKQGEFSRNHINVLICERSIQ